MKETKKSLGELATETKNKQSEKFHHKKFPLPKKHEKTNY